MDLVQIDAQSPGSSVASLAARLAKRVHIPVNGSTPPRQVVAINSDPWSQSGKYALGWVYFGIILLAGAVVFRLFNWWGDRIRTALYKEEVIRSATTASPFSPIHHLSGPPTGMTDRSTRHFFPPHGPLLRQRGPSQSAISAFQPLNNGIALVRFIFYRPIPPLRLWLVTITFPSPGVSLITLAGTAFALLYCFLPQPLLYRTLEYGSPPLAIRAGMMSVALLPWVVAMSAKVNVVSFLTGIGPERLIVFHRLGAYLCFALAIVHAVPYWWQSVHDPDGFNVFTSYFNQQYYIFTTGIVALAPFLLLVLHSLPVVRNRSYELFVLVHQPLSWAFVGVMFWHCHNYLTSWAYLYATVVVLAISFFGRLFFQNWLNPARASFLIGEESALTVLPENAIKVTIPSQRRWKPGQHAYLRLPGIATFESHPFTIASLCSDAFPSSYGDEYRDMTMVFRPFGGFTRKVLEAAGKKGPYKTYRAFVEGPYGGMERQMSSFDQVVFFAGGSGITAICSQLLDLIQRMRDGKATTTTVHVIWAMKRPEIMEWFKEELRICREFAPPDSVHCNFYITASNRHSPRPVSRSSLGRLSGLFGDKAGVMLHGLRSKTSSGIARPVHLDLEKELEHDLTALPRTVTPTPPTFSDRPIPRFPPPPVAATSRTRSKLRKSRSTVAATETHAGTALTSYSSSSMREAGESQHMTDAAAPLSTMQTFDFGFETSKETLPDQHSPMQYNLLRSSVQRPPTSITSPEPVYRSPQDIMPAYSSPRFPLRVEPWRSRDGWRTDYGRPDIGQVLRHLSRDFGRRTCVFVCGPPEMRVDVARSVASLQRVIWNDPSKDELFLHTENYAI